MAVTNSCRYICVCVFVLFNNFVGTRQWVSEQGITSQFKTISNNESKEKKKKKMVLQQSIKCVYNCFYFIWSTVIAIAKISHTRNHVSVVVCQIQKFVSSIWVKKRHPLRIFHFVSIWCPMNTSNWVRKHWKPDVFVATNTWSNIAVKINSTFGCEYIHSTLFVSTRCYRVPEPIGKPINHIIFVCVLLMLKIDNATERKDKYKHFILFLWWYCFEHWVMNETMITHNFDILTLITN